MYQTSQPVNRRIISGDAVLLYIILFFSNDTYLFGTNVNEARISLARYLLIFFCGVLIYRMGGLIKYSINKGKIVGFLLIFISYIIVARLNDEVTNRVVIKLLYMLVAILICMTFEFTRFSKAYRQCLYFISICAISFSLIGYLVPSLIRNLPYITNTVGIRIYTCGLSGINEVSLSSNFIRAQGIFWEPGVFQMYVNLALCFELYLSERPTRKRVWVYIIAVFFSFSTTGFIVTSWIILCYLLLKKSNITQKYSGRSVLLVFVFVTLGFLLLQVTEVGVLVFDKIINPTVSGTTMVRVAGVVTNIEIALAHPWHGIGMENIQDEFLKLTMASQIILGFTRQNTNTLLYQYAAHGIPYGILFTLGTYKFANLLSRGEKLIKLSVFIMIVMLYIGENLQYSELPYIIIFYGYGCYDKSESKYYLSMTEGEVNVSL